MFWGAPSWSKSSENVWILSLWKVWFEPKTFKVDEVHLVHVLATCRSAKTRQCLSRHAEVIDVSFHGEMLRARKLLRWSFRRLYNYFLPFFLEEIIQKGQKCCAAWFQLAIEELPIEMLSAIYARIALSVINSGTYPSHHYWQASNLGHLYMLKWGIDLLKMCNTLKHAVRKEGTEIEIAHTKMVN